jgi:C1A family cysteine protease
MVRVTCALAVALAGVLAIPVMAQNAASGSASSPLAAAPQSTRFTQALSALRQKTPLLATTPTGHSFGLLPEPLELPHLASQGGIGAETAASLPTSFDLRTSGKVTPVKDQGDCGSCWAFGTYGSMESDLEPGETDDLSENNLKDLAGFDLSPCSGGNGFMSMAYVARWAGPVDAALDPYHATDTDTSPAGISPEKHVQDVIIIAGRGSVSNNNSLKSALMTYGGLTTVMYWDDSAYNSATASYYYSNSGYGNHMVTLVGWDDNYSSKNFAKVPPGNGAFLAKNSWGTSFGQSGFFWISYYDAIYAFNDYSYAFSGNQAVTNYGRQYEYDPLGWVGSYGYGNPTASFANVFTAVASEPLQAVSFYVPSNNSPYVVNVYTGVKTGPTSGTLAATVSGVEAYAGYHTVTLPQPVTLTAKANFSVAVTLTTPGFT